MHRPLLVFAALLSLSVALRAAPKPDPLTFFTGRTQSSGYFENRRGEPTRPVRTETRGRLVNGGLQLEQDLFIGDQPRQRRTWTMRRIDGRHFEATAHDMIGSARGRLDGEHFTWTFRLATKPGNPLFNVRMTQHMYFAPDGRSMVNRTTVRKLGFFVAGVTELFQRER